MKKILFATIFLLAAVCVKAQDFSDPRYAVWGDTEEERRENILTSNLLKEAVDTRDYVAATGYFQKLMTAAPKASEATFIRGAQVYSSKVQRAKSLDEKKVMLDSLMLIYDLRVQHFADSPNYGKAYVLDRKAGEYLAFNPGDREGVKKMYNEAIEAGLASGYGNLSEVALIHFKNVTDDYAAGDVYPDVVLKEYERLVPIFESEDPAVKANGEKFDTLFGTSGVASCDNLESMFRPRLAAAPDDVQLHRQAVSLLGRAGCSSEFFLTTAERYYALSPSSETARQLANGFFAAGDYTKAGQYLRETLAKESDAKERVELLLALSKVELAMGRTSAAAEAAVEARGLDSNNGMALFALAQAYAASAAGCGGVDGQANYWVAYDAMAQAANLLSGDATYASTARELMGRYHAAFPSREDLFFHELGEGSRYTVTCGAARGITTTVRAR